MKIKTIILSFAAGILSLQAHTTLARDHIEIVGSSTVYPFAKSVSRRFSQITNLASPKIEASGSGSGFKLFCKGVGESFPDINNASRQMKPSERKLCAANGVTGISEFLIGYDGIVLANSALVDQYSFTVKDLAEGLSKWHINSSGKLEENKFTSWQQVNRLLPDVKIQVFGPPKSSGTRDAFIDLVLTKYAEENPIFESLTNLKNSDTDQIKQQMAELNIPTSIWDSIVEKKGDNATGKDLVKAITKQVREDDAYVEMGENDNAMVNNLVTSPYALGILGYGFLQQNQTKIKAAKINDSSPSSNNIGNGSYPLARGLYFYVKNAHIGVIPGLYDYTKLFLSRTEVGEKGYLQNIGLITLDKATYQAVRKTVKELGSKS